MDHEHEIGDGNRHAPPIQIKANGPNMGMMKIIPNTATKHKPRMLPTASLIAAGRDIGLPFVILLSR